MALPAKNQKSFHLFVTHVDGEGHFLKISGQLDQQSALKIESLFKSSSNDLESGVGAPTPTAICEGILCAAKYKGGSYCRAKIINTANLSSGFVGVHFIDFGNKDVISLSNIRLLENYDPLFMHLQGQSFDYYLSRLIHPAGRWDEPLMLKLQSLICNTEYFATIDSEIRPYPLISLQFMGNDLSTYLVLNGLGFSIPFIKQEMLLQLLGENQPVAHWQLNLLKQSQNSPEDVPFLLNQNFPSNPASAMCNAQDLALPFNTSIPSPSPISQSLFVNKVSENPINLKTPDGQPQPNTPPSIPNSSSTTYKSIPLETNTQHKVFISYAGEGPEKFSVQLVNNATKLQDMMNKINKRLHSSLKDPPMMGGRCLGRMSRDKVISRAIVMNLYDSQCMLFFVDCGDTEMVSYYDIFDIPEEFIEPPVFSLRFCLSGGKKLKKGPYLKEAFKQLVDGKVVMLKVVEPEGPPLIQYGELYMDNVNVLDLLLQLSDFQTITPELLQLPAQAMQCALKLKSTTPEHKEESFSFPESEKIFVDDPHPPRDNEELGQRRSSLRNRDANDGFGRFYRAGPSRHSAKFDGGLYRGDRNNNDGFDRFDRPGLNKHKFDGWLHRDDRDNKYNNDREENATNDWDNKTSREHRGDRPNRGERFVTWADDKENSWNQKLGERFGAWGDKENSWNQNLGERSVALGDKKEYSWNQKRDAKGDDEAKSNFTPRDRAERSFIGRAPSYQSGSKFTQGQFKELPDPLPLETPFSDPIVELGAQHEVSVTWIISPENFYTQILSLQPQFVDLMHKIPELYKGVKSYLGTVPVGASVLARYPSDGVLYRAEVVSVQPFSKFVVRYVDFGNKQLVDAKDIWQMDRQLMDLPKMAVHCSLLGVAPVDTEWKANPDIDLCFNAPRYQCVFQDCVDRPYKVSLWNNGASVADTLVEKQLAVISAQQSSVTVKDEAIDLTTIVGQKIMCRVTQVESFDKFYVQLDLDKVLLVENAIANYDVNQLMILPAELCQYNNQSLECCLNNYTEESNKLLSLEELKHKLTDNKFIIYINSVDGISLVTTLYDAITGQKIAIFEPDEGAYDQVVQLCMRSVYNYNFGMAYILHLENLNEIYLSKLTDSDKIAQLLDELYKFYEEGTPEPLLEFKVDGVCAAKSNDGNWYRATIVEATENVIKVQYLDYGNTESLPKDSLKLLDSKFFEPCAFALVVSLGLVALQDDTLAKLTEWTTDKEVQVTLAFGTDGWLASLHLDGVDLSLKLVNEKLATPQMISDEEQKKEAPIEEPISPLQGYTQVYIRHIDTPGHFWLQMADKVDNIEVLQSELQANVGNYPVIETRDIGTLCIAKYSADDLWYRAEILDSTVDITTVRFIDYGNTDVLHNQHEKLKQMPDHLKATERYAVKSSINAVPTETGQWSEPASDYFTQLFGDLSAPVDALIVLKDTMTYVDIFVNGQNLTDKLVSEGHATRSDEPECRDLPSCFASHVNSPSEFWIQLETATAELQAIESAMVDTENFSKLNENEEGVICALKCPQNGAWYDLKPDTKVSKFSDISECKEIKKDDTRKFINIEEVTDKAQTDAEYTNTGDVCSNELNISQPDLDESIDNEDSGHTLVENKCFESNLDISECKEIKKDDTSKFTNIEEVIDEAQTDTEYTNTGDVCSNELNISQPDLDESIDNEDSGHTLVENKCFESNLDISECKEIKKDDTSKFTNIEEVTDEAQTDAEYTNTGDVCSNELNMSQPDLDESIDNEDSGHTLVENKCFESNLDISECKEIKKDDTSKFINIEEVTDKAQTDAEYTNTGDVCSNELNMSQPDLDESIDNEDSGHTLVENKCFESNLDISECKEIKKDDTSKFTNIEEVTDEAQTEGEYTNTGDVCSNELNISQPDLDESIDNEDGDHTLVENKCFESNLDISECKEIKKDDTSKFTNIEEVTDEAQTEGEYTNTGDVCSNELNISQPDLDESIDNEDGDHTLVENKCFESNHDISECKEIKKDDTSKFTNIEEVTDEAHTQDEYTNMHDACSNKLNISQPDLYESIDSKDSGHPENKSFESKLDSSSNMIIETVSDSATAPVKDDSAYLEKSSETIEISDRDNYKNSINTDTKYTSNREKLPTGSQTSEAIDSNVERFQEKVPTEDNIVDTKIDSQKDNVSEVISKD